MILMLDNYDSFTYNLVQYLRELHAQIVVYRNDQIDIQTIKQLNPEKIIISPGPGCPTQAGITLDLIKAFAGKLPILGICLGHQSIAQAFGGKVVTAKSIMHGKTSLMYHHHDGVFRQLKNPFQATRYHSLVIDQKSLPSDLIITAYTKNMNGEMDEIMGIKHKDWPLEGVQFHPESILTEQGHQLLNNFITEQTITKSNTPMSSSPSRANA